MPLMNGYIATEIIVKKAAESNKTVKIIGYTSYLTE